VLASQPHTIRKGTRPCLSRKTITVQVFISPTPHIGPVIVGGVSVVVWGVSEHVMRDVACMFGLSVLHTLSTRPVAHNRVHTQERQPHQLGQQRERERPRTRQTASKRRSERETGSTQETQRARDRQTGTDRSRLGRQGARGVDNGHGYTSNGRIKETGGSEKREDQREREK
jgi:hypothetical protein